MIFLINDELSNREFLDLCTNDGIKYTFLILKDLIYLAKGPFPMSSHICRFLLKPPPPEIYKPTITVV